MKSSFRILILLAILWLADTPAAFSQTEPDTVKKSQASQVRRKEISGKDKKTPGGIATSTRRPSAETAAETHAADLEYMRQIYRRLDLTKSPNAALFYPEDVVEGEENLFRIIFRLVAGGSLPAYEYLDGREIFTQNYRVSPADIVKRFNIEAKEVKVKGKADPTFVVEEADVPTSQVLDYYIIEKWEFDRRSNRMKTRVEALCPVLTRSNEVGSEMRYPMFWIKLDDLNPYLKDTFVFVDDDNNVPRYSLSDFFSLGLYEGEIYKTRNLRNLSMEQMFPDEDDRKRAQDSIDNRLKNYGKNLWVPSREEYLAMKELEEERQKKIEAGDSIPERTTVVATGKASTTRSSAKTSRRRSAKKASAKSSGVKSSSSGSANSGAAKSVRRRRR